MDRSHYPTRITRLHDQDEDNYIKSLSPILYLINTCITMDLMIFLKTAGVVLFHKGAA